MPNEPTTRTELHYLIVTGARSKTVVTLSRKADTTALKTQRRVIRGHTCPRASL